MFFCFIKKFQLGFAIRIALFFLFSSFVYYKSTVKCKKKKKMSVAKALHFKKLPVNTLEKTNHEKPLNETFLKRLLRIKLKILSNLL